MSAKLLCATAVMAMGSFMFVDTADAQRRGGAERGDNGRVEAGQRRGRGGARQARGSRNAGQARGGNRTARADRARPNRARPARADRARPNRSRAARVRPGSRVLPPRAQARARAARNIHRKRSRRANRNAFSRGWRQARRWAGRTWAARPYYNDYGCTAVARRDDGNGRVIRGIYGEGYGRRACRKALNRCEDQLSYRQAEGRNPYAACVVASR